MTANGLIWVVLPGKRLAGIQTWVTLGLLVGNGRIAKAAPYACKLGWQPGRDAREVWREMARRRPERLEWLPADETAGPVASPCHTRSVP